jgi:hypothetical protein
MMRYRYLLLTIVIVVLGLAACKKDNKSSVAIIGKWQETKLRIYATDSTGAFLYDTTFLSPFTGSDYLQFNSNNTCIIGTDYYYYPNQTNGQQIPPQKITPVTSAMKYTALGSKFVLTQQSTLVNPGGFDVRDTVSAISSNTLLYHSVGYSHVPGIKTMADAYYTK